MIWRSFTRADASPENLARIVRYEEGKLYWCHRTDTMFADAWVQRRWNRNNAGQPVPFYPNDRGALKFAINRNSFFVHRVIWAVVHGEWPDVIDHINGNPADNRIENLRSVDQTINARNRALHKNSKSGVPGVTWNKRDRAWIAQLRTKTVKHVSYHKRLEDAVAARLKAESGMGFILREPCA